MIWISISSLILLVVIFLIHVVYVERKIDDLRFEINVINNLLFGKVEEGINNEYDSE